MEVEAIYESEDFLVDVEMDAHESQIEFNGAYFSDYYIVINKSTGIVEFKTPSVVEAISGAAMAQASLDTQPWKFYGKQVSLAETLDALTDSATPEGGTH